MWPAILFVYAVGVAATAVAVFRNRIFGQAYLVNAGAAVFWPVYWSLYLFTVVAQGRQKPPK